jgi:hypothetical protein
MWLSDVAEHHNDWHLDPGSVHFYTLMAAHNPIVHTLKRRAMLADTQHLHNKCDDWWPQYSLDTTYRVSICDATKRVEVICFGIGSLANGVTGKYTEEADLPDWMRQKLSVLRILSLPPPIEDIPDVGRRLKENLFWVYHT